MPASTSPARIPAQIESGLQQLGALAALLSCVDLDRWNSLGGPSPRGLSALIWRAQADLQQGLGELDLTPAND